MAFEKVDPKVDFPALERGILKFWEESRAFERLRELNRGKPKWSFLDGPITANNPMGVHHAWGRTYKDIYQRYWAAAPWEVRGGSASALSANLGQGIASGVAGMSASGANEESGAGATSSPAGSRCHTGPHHTGPHHTGPHHIGSPHTGLHHTGSRQTGSRQTGPCDAGSGFGHELRYQNGFDCQGLWVEVEVEKEHGFASKKDIEAYGIGRFVEECKARADRFARIQTQQSIRLGQWMDWDCSDDDWAKPSGQRRSYFTMSDENNYAIWAFLKKCFEKGLIYKGVDVMPWCPRCGTGISQMEMNEGYREVPHTSVFIKLPLRERKDENLLVWTTTPWTLSSNVAAAVHPEMTYVKVKQGDQFYYLGKANFQGARTHPIQSLDPKKLPSLMNPQAMFKNNGPFEVVQELSGKELVGLTYDGPFDQLPGAAEAVPAHRVIPWEEVTGTEGTGIVHIAPGCGAEDYHLGKELGLPQIAPLFEDGKFRPEFGFLAGKRFDQVADDVARDLKGRGLLFAKEQYYHRYPHCWRCKDELVYRLVDEWFINMNWREQIMASARQARWIPEWGLDREIDWLVNMGDWMISKKRYWGLALPIWECHQCGHFEVIGGRDELKARAVSGWAEFEGKSPHRPWVDVVKIRCAQCGDTNVSRIKDVGNPWLDASIVPFSTIPGYFTDREAWRQWFPADFVVEALPGQFRNWFYALLAVSTMMEGCSPFKVLKGHGLVMDDEGKPMHKSAGNAIEFNQAADSIGVDVMRWLYASTSPERNVLFGPKHCDEVRRDVILPWWNVYSFFCNLARADDFKPREHTATEAERSLLDRWILSELHRLIGVAHESYSNYDVGRLCTEATRFIDVLSTWYVRRSRRRFYADGWPVDKRAAYATLYEVLTTFNRVIAPIVPFLSEAVYQNLVARQLGDVPASVHHVPMPRYGADRVDESLIPLVNASIRLVSLGRSARKDSKLKVRQPLAEFRVVAGNDAERAAVKQFADEMAEELNVKQVTLADSASDLVRFSIEANLKTLGPKLGRLVGAARAEIQKLDPQQTAERLDRGESISLTLEGNPTPLDREDLIVSRAFHADWAGAADGKTIVLLDRRVTTELKNEGIARDIIRNVQNLRKDAGLDISDRIRLSLASSSPDITAAIDMFRDYIAGETLAVEIGRESIAKSQINGELEIEGQRVAIALAKAS